MLSIAASTCPRCGADRATSEYESRCGCGYLFANRNALPEAEAAWQAAQEQETSATARQTYAAMAIWSFGTLVPFAVFAVSPAFVAGALDRAIGRELLGSTFLAWIGGSLYTAFRILVLFTRPSTDHRIRLVWWASGVIIAVAVLASGELSSNALRVVWVVAPAISAVVTLIWRRQA